MAPEGFLFAPEYTGLQRLNLSASGKLQAG